MNKKGFTLVELLAVIVLLGIIGVIVSTNGFGIFNTTKTKITEENIKAIEEGAQVYLTDVEYCDDDLKEYNELGEIIDVPFDNCYKLNLYFKTYKTVYILLDKLIDSGYISGNSISEISEKEDIYITAKYNDETEKLTAECNLCDDLLNNNGSIAMLKQFSGEKSIAYTEGIDYKNQIKKIKFVNNIKHGNKFWEVNDSGYDTIYAWINGDHTELTIGAKGTIYANPTSSRLFSGFTNLESIDFTNFNTSKVTMMVQMFNNCSNLNKLDLSKWNTTNVQSVASMFAHTDHLTEIDLSGWDLSKTTGFSRLFNRTGSKNETPTDVILNSSLCNNGNIKSFSNVNFIGCEDIE